MWACEFRLQGEQQHNERIMNLINVCIIDSTCFIGEVSLALATSPGGAGDQN